MTVKITYLWNDYSYYVRSTNLSDAKDSWDRQVAEECIKTRKTVCFGKILAEPVN